jgi:hypothetical protein
MDPRQTELAPSFCFDSPYGNEAALGRLIKPQAPDRHAFRSGTVPEQALRLGTHLTSFQIRTWRRGVLRRGINIRAENYSERVISLRASEGLVRIDRFLNGYVRRPAETMARGDEKTSLGGMHFSKK